MKTISKIILILLGTILMKPTSAQLYTGGTTSMNFDGGVYVDLAPIIGYRILSLNVGVSPIFSYSNRLDVKGAYAWGGRIFAEYTVLKGIFVHGEIEGQNSEKVSISDLGVTTKSRIWTAAAPFGVGYEYVIMKGVRAQGMVLYDLLHTKDSPSQNPIIRGGVTYDLP